jgi:hypothetical protein
MLALIETAKFALEESDDVSLETPLHDISEKEFSESLRAHVANLTRLSPSLSCPAESDSDDDEKPWDGSTTQDIPAHQFFAALIEARFPKADVKLTKVLGESNWSRYNHIKRLRTTLL